MTDQGPFRTEPAVIKLEAQLRDKSEECEDLRAKIVTLEAQFLQQAREHNALLENDRRNAREWWTWRLTLVIAAAVALSLIYWGYRSSMQPEGPEGACRDSIVTVGGYGWDKCPYEKQIMGEIKDGKVRCTCPTAAPAGSK